ncbi:MAG TPA: hypothetical protein VHW74_10520 [Mycobacteriales bacterium]|jgi:hypothetical protein|nr:hypothetical protein [Mycobacteriales bacterium]
MSSSTPDFKALSRNDQVFLGAGVVALIFSFIDFAHVTASGVSGSGPSESAWHGVGILAALLLLLGVLVAAANVFAPDALSALPVPARLASTGLTVLALLFFVIRWLTLPSDNFFGTHVGFTLAWGGYVLLVLTVVTAAFGFLGMKENGVAIPGTGG